MLIAVEPLHSQWYWKNPLPQGNNLFSVVTIPGTSSLVIVGAAGSILSSSDKGNTWDIKYYQYDSSGFPSLRGVYFSTVNKGYVVGSSGVILKTMDGGATWQKQNSNTTTSFTSVYFINDVEGYATGSGVSGSFQNPVYTAAIFKTTNGGLSWDSLFSEAGYALSSVYFTSATTGYVVGGDPILKTGKILKTTDTGKTWSPLQAPVNQYFVSVRFTDQSTGYIAGYSGGILKTLNGGISWTDISVNYSLNGISFITPTMGFVVGSAILKTTDAGIHWNLQLTNPFGSFSSISILDSLHAYVAGTYGTILFTTNGGDNWYPKSSSTTNASLASVSTVNELVAYAVGDSGIILKTTDGGSLWTRKTSGVTSQLFSVRRVDSLTTYAVGDSGKILKTINGGATWESLNSGVTNTLIGLSVADPKTVYTVGESGIILKTTNSGLNWFPKVSNTSKTLRAVHCPTLTSAYAIEYTDSILKTTNGGTNWLKVSISKSAVNGTYYLNGLYFTDSITGYVVGDSETTTDYYGVILKTTNGGINWINQLSSFRRSITSIYFIDRVTGYAGSRNGDLYKTTNGGSVWIPIFSPAESYITSISFSNSKTGFAVGTSGTILKTTNGGVSFVDEGQQNIPSSFVLSQNYPNPFSQSTVISCQSLVGRTREFVVRDMLGRVIYHSTLDPSQTEVRFDGSQLSHGVYLYMISNGESVETGKMVIL